MATPLDRLTTEAINPASARLDELSTPELVALMGREDADVPAAVDRENGPIARAIDAVAARLARGGRLIYMGAGTSGRLGVLDAAECPPTFQSDPSQIVGLIAGGQRAMFRAVEGAEDSHELGAADLRDLQLAEEDCVCGIAASGRTPYVLGGMRYARSVGAYTIGVACNADSELEAEVDLPIVPVVGPEVLSGSTRLKAGTATKLVLNRITTGAFVRLGKTFGNLMVDLNASNEKLVARSRRIVARITGLDVEASALLLGSCDGEVKTALVTHTCRVDADAARLKLAGTGGRVGPLLRAAHPAKPLEGLSPVGDDLVIGVDGGGTKTFAVLADRATGAALGRGAAGPSNVMAVGTEAGLAAIATAIERAFAAANRPNCQVAAATLGLAGVDRQSGLELVRGWATRSAIARDVLIANDATLLLAAGTPDGWGLATIAGTGSIAFVRDPAGTVRRAGGWGYVLGDEGSAYRLTLAALHAVCHAADGAGPSTALTDALLRAMSVADVPNLIPAIYQGPWDRAALAGLAPVVLAAAESDVVAAEIVASGAADLALTAAAAVQSQALPAGPVPTALAGGLLLGSERYRTAFLSALRSHGIEVGPVMPVAEPALGAVVLAQRLLTAI